MEIKLRSLTTSDLENMMSWVNDPQVVGRFNKLGKLITPEEELRYLEQITTSQTDKVYAIETRDGAYVGNIGLHEINTDLRSARYGLIIGKREYWGQGYGTAAAEALLKTAFLEQDFELIWGKFLVSNKKNGHLNVEKLGFKVEGVLPGEYELNGQYHDMIKVSMSKEDYLKRRSL